jgi:hypothetical protein
MHRAVIALLGTVACASPALAAPSAPAAGSTKPAAPTPPPPVILGALPARIEFVAWLPVEKAADQLDLDLRVEVVLPRSCGDKLLGLFRRSGPRLDAPDVYDPILVRNSTGECGKDAVRIGAREAIRMRIPDGQTRELQIGERVVRVTRKGKDVTVDGEGPQGDVPGAPPTARPSALVAGEVTAAKVTSAKRLADPWVVGADVQVTAKWPACAGAPVGFLGRGDASTHYALTRFEPIARAALDEPCKSDASRTAVVPLTVRAPLKAAEQAITVGGVALSVKPGVAPPAAVAAKPAVNAAAPAR